MIVKIMAISQAKKFIANCKEVLLPEESSLSDLLIKIGLNESSPFIYAKNGKICTSSIKLNDNDEISIIPIIGGG